MKTLDTTKITDLIRMISLVVILAYMAMHFIRFIRNYLLLPAWYCALYSSNIFLNTYFRSGLKNRVIHDKKHALFTGRPLMLPIELRPEMDRNSGLANHKNPALNKIQGKASDLNRCINLRFAFIPKCILPL